MKMENNPTDILVKNSVPRGVAGGFFIYSVSGDEGILYADPNVIELFGCRDIDELRVHTNNSFRGMVYPEDREKVDSTIVEYNSDNNKPRHYIRYRIVTKQGTYRYVEDFGRRLRSVDGKVYCYVFIAGIDEAEYEIPKQVIFNEVLYSSSEMNKDRLTGLLNMESFMKKAREMEPDFQENADLFSTVIVFDILGLREINQTFGHSEGDERIRNLAEALEANMPEGSCLYRGNEADIIVVCDGVDEQSVMEHIVAAIHACKSPILFGIGSAGRSSAIQNSKEETFLLRGLEEAQFDIHIKKMLNAKSNRSQSLTTLIRALEEVDADTEAHVQRTQKTGIALGRRIGLSDVQLSMLQLLCLLHDIGKIAVPLEILNKPGKLTDDEWAVLRSHSEKGYQIAVATKELRPLADMILSHHERWDGRGYPNGLREEEIPVLSRIISIVDAYDAMVNDRSYRKALSPEKAKQEILDNAGTQFDPYLAKEFLALLEDNPSLSYGTKTGGSEVRVYDRSVSVSTGEGQTRPIAFSRYKLNMDDIIIEVDDAFTAITGYSAEDAVGKLSQFDLVPEQEKEYYTEQVHCQFAVQDITYLQHPLKRKDGTVIQVVSNGTRYFDSSVRAFRSVILIFEVQ